MWLLAIGCGLVVGKTLIHGIILSRFLRLKMFRANQVSMGYVKRIVLEWTLAPRMITEYFPFVLRKALRVNMLRLIELFLRT